MGQSGVGDDTDCLRTAQIDRVGVTKGGQGVGELVDGGLETDHVTRCRAQEQGRSAVIVRAARPHTPLPGLLISLGLGRFRVSLPLRGPHDPLHPQRSQGVQNVCDAFVHQRGRLLGEPVASRGDLAGLPLRGMTGPNLRPSHRQPMPQRQRLTHEMRGRILPSPRHRPELRRHELRHRRTSHPAVDLPPLPPLNRRRHMTTSHTGRVGMQVGEVQGMFDQRDVDLDPLLMKTRRRGESRPCVELIQI